jgi:glucose/arabinose dehydrogenase
MSRFVTLITELALLAAAALVGAFAFNNVKVIPPGVIAFPSYHYATNQLLAIAGAYIACHAVTFVALAAIVGVNRFDSPRRMALAAYGMLFGFSLASAIVFLLTLLPFDPNMVVGLELVILGAFLVVFVARALVARGGGGALGALGRFAGQLVVGLGSPIAWVAIAMAAVLVGSAYGFVSDRDFANKVTEIRLMLSEGGGARYGLVNAFDGATFRQPVLTRFAPGDPATAWVLERHGQIVRLPYGQAGPAEVVLDIADKLGWVEIELGALGFAFHPEFGIAGSPNAGFIYLYYTEFREDGEAKSQINRLSRFDIALPDPATRRASEQVLIEQTRPASGFHNGGSVEFGPDGFLYLAVGEATYPKSHQTLGVDLLGGIMRIDVDRKGGAISHPIRRQPAHGKTQGYFIPSDNPFVGQPDALEEYWALGLRNPFRVAFDPETGNLWAGDVGSDVWEEVNLVVKGGNYQFPFVEGTEPTGKARPDPLIGVETGPLHWYRHTSTDRAVIGGIVYRGDHYPDLVGRYVFADNYSSKIMAMPANGSVAETVDVIARANQFAQRGVSSVTAAPDGAILVTTLGRDADAGGEVLRLVAGAEAEAAAQATATQPTEDEPGAPTAAEIAGLFASNCGRCHGVTGRSDGPDSEELEVRPPDMASAAWQDGITDEQIRRIIVEGGEAVGKNAAMPPWDGVLTEAEIDGLIAHLRSLRQ